MNLARTIDFDLPQLFHLANALMHARGFVPSHIQHPGAVVAAILTGRELGVPPMASLRSIKFVDGTPVFDAALHLGIMIARGVKYRWVSDGSDGTAQLWLQRPDQEPYVSVYTMDMAKKAELLGKKNWQRYPAAMLRARAVSAASRAYMPDVLAGCFVPGELEADRDETPPNQSMEPANVEAMNRAEGQGAPAAPAPAALPAQTANAAPLDLPGQLVRDFYAIDSATRLNELIATAAGAWGGFKRDEKLAIKTAREWAEKRVVELEAERVEREREAAAAEAALSAKADAAIGGQGAPGGGAVDDAPEPGSNDEPDVEAPHEPDAGFGGAEVVQQ